MRTATPLFLAAAAWLTIGTASLLAQPATAPAIKLEHPEVRDNAVTIPAAFWNEGVADWLEVAISGRPSEFLHETLICISTTQADMIQAMHKTGFRNATDVARNFEEFKQIRGDRALILLEVTRDGKTDTYMLEELLEFRGWGTSVGPLGFCFKGTAPGAVQQAAAAGEEGKALSDAQRILMDDPQAALTFKGLQHASRSFVDFSLAYDEWLFPPLSIGRNTALLPADVLNSNGKVPVTLIIRKVTETQALEAVTKYWHHAPMKAVAQKLMPVAKELDAAKQTFAAAKDGSEKVAAFMAVQAGYARMDADFVQCALKQSSFKDDDKESAAQKKQATQFVDHLEKAAVFHEQQHAAFDALGKLPEMQEHRALSQIALYEDQLIYWREQKGLLDPQDDPRKDWVARVNLELEHIQVALELARLELSLAQKTPVGQDLPTTPERTALYQRMDLARLKLRLMQVQMEIIRQQNYTDDQAAARVAQLKAHQAALEKEIRDAEKK